MLAADPTAVEARVRALCLALPETGERVSHGIPAFDVAGKMFAYFRHDHHADGMTVVCVKTSGRDEQEMLWEADPATYIKPAYLWPSGWVGIVLERADWDLVEVRLKTSWRLAAPKQLQRSSLP
ncbi:MmcQ/YjbR family DNA-binding protein [uncultured Phenylobacterium sp.]|uniref:MmcQ/YjbR family DNA-binding protein n=1 Tax=uncultured Phenylobacterium sp. TaxID=349273 RepID=UPI002600013F|nr:MmcQ/YjbR family DNA-binding protein [uncultured Phenylobacterium sp.]